MKRTIVVGVSGRDCACLAARLAALSLPELARRPLQAEMDGIRTGG
jgi:hypothetical protein